MLNGEYYPILDAKNRFFLPPKFRDALGSELVLFKSPDKEAPCLFLYSAERWEEISGSFMRNLPNNRVGRALERKFSASSTDVEVDKAGRITVNQQLKEYAGLTKELAVVGATGRVEIWDKEAWLKEQEIIEDFSVEDLDIQF